MRTKIQILFIHHTTGWGGSPNSMIKLINSLDKERFEAKVLLLKNSSIVEKLLENNINYAIADSWFYKNNYSSFTHSEAGYIKWHQAYSFIKHLVFWLLSRYYFANRELLKHRFDIAHLNSSVLTDWLAPASRHGKVVIHIREPFRRGNYDILQSFFRSQMRKYANRIVAISKDNAKRIEIPDKTTVIYNYAEIPKTAPSDYSYKSKKVLYLGGSATIKGYFTLVDALDFLDKNVRVLFGGYYHTTNNPKSLKDWIKHIVRLMIRKKYISAYKKISQHPNAILIGLTHNVNDYLSETCCLVSPFSAPHFARPIIEAYLHKKPVIGSDVDGMNEIIEHEVTGLIVPKNNAMELAMAINNLTRNSKKAKKFGEAGFAIAIEKFTDKNVCKFEQMYNKIL